MTGQIINRNAARRVFEHGIFKPNRVNFRITIGLVDVSGQISEKFEHQGVGELFQMIACALWPDAFFCQTLYNRLHVFQITQKNRRMQGGFGP